MLWGDRVDLYNKLHTFIIIPLLNTADLWSHHNIDVNLGL